MTRHLRREGYTVGRKRVRRLMARMGLEPIYQRPRTTIPHPGHRIYPYLLRDLVIDGPNQVWCADITYIPMRRGFHYLIAIMDWSTRKVLSWRVSNTMDGEFCIEALEEALARLGCPEIFNTDQGSQFTSPRFTGVLEKAGVRISMDGRGRWMDCENVGSSGWPGRPSSLRCIVQTRKPALVVTMNPIAQRLPIHASGACRFAATVAFHHQGKREHPARRCCVLATRCRRTKTHRIQLRPRDRHRHPRLLDAAEQANQTPSSRSNSHSSQLNRRLVLERKREQREGERHAHHVRPWRVSVQESDIHSPRAQKVLR